MERQDQGLQIVQKKSRVLKNIKAKNTCLLKLQDGSALHFSIALHFHFNIFILVKDEDRTYTDPALGSRTL